MCCDCLLEDGNQKLVPGELTWIHLDKDPCRRILIRTPHTPGFGAGRHAFHPSQTTASSCVHINDSLRRLLFLITHTCYVCCCLPTLEEAVCNFTPIPFSDIFTEDSTTVHGLFIYYSQAVIRWYFCKRVAFCSLYLLGHHHWLYLMFRFMIGSCLPLWSMDVSILSVSA